MINSVVIRITHIKGGWKAMDSIDSPRQAQKKRKEEENRKPRIHCQQQTAIYQQTMCKQWQRDTLWQKSTGEKTFYMMLWIWKRQWHSQLSWFVKHKSSSAYRYSMYSCPRLNFFSFKRSQVCIRMLSRRMNELPSSSWPELCATFPVRQHVSYISLWDLEQDLAPCGPLSLYLVSFCLCLRIG